MARTELVGVRVTKDMKAALKKMAEADTRSVAAIIYLILKEYLAKKANR
jgi:hypothetical protein